MPRNLNIKAPRLGRNRLGVFFVRFPSYVDHLGKRRVVQQSLRTKDPTTAKFLALQFCLDLAQMGGKVSSNDPKLGVNPWTVNVDTGEFIAEGAEDSRLLTEFMKDNKDLLETLAKLRAAKSATMPHGSVIPPFSATTLPQANTLSGTRLEEAFELHLGTETASLTEHTINEKRGLFREFLAVFGCDTDIRGITAEQITKRWTPVEVQRPNQKKPDATLSLSRLEKRRGYLLKFFDWAKTSGLYGLENPMQAKFAKKKVIRSQTESWAEFNTDEIEKIFAPAYVAHMEKPDWYWVPLMGLFSGARLGELCELTLADFMIIEGIEVFEITEGKTDKSRRVVPIHSKLLELGLWSCVEALRARGATHFLHHRPADYQSKSVGREFSVWLGECGVKTARKVFHSFRSTAITDMHNSEAGAAAIRRAVGHATAGTSGVHGDYIRGIHLIRLKEAIEKLSFSTVDFAKLQLPDPTFKAFFDADEAKRDSAGYIRQQQRRQALAAANKKKLANLPLAS